MRLWRNTRCTPHPVWQLLCCAVFALLPGCHPSDPEVKNTSAPSPPRSAELLLNLPADGLDQLDFLALSGCAVQATIIKRNSSLGRLAKPSQRLLLELEYLQLAPPCITQLRGSNNDALANLLEEARHLRREQLPALIFNATLGSDEYQAFWLAVPAPGQYPRVSRTVAASALDAINKHARRWLGGDYQAQNRDIEVLLGEVAGGGGGALLQARTDGLDRSHQQLLPPIADLEAQLTPVLPQRYRSWIDERNQRFIELANASCNQLKQVERGKQTCPAEQARPCPKIGKLVTLETMPGRCGPAAEE